MNNFKMNKKIEPFKISKIPKFGNFLIIVLRAEIVTTFGSKMVVISTRNKKYRKFANFARLYFLYFTASLYYF